MAPLETDRRQINRVAGCRRDMHLSLAPETEWRGASIVRSCCRVSRLARRFLKQWRTMLLEQTVPRIGERVLRIQQRDPVLLQSLVRQNMPWIDGDVGNVVGTC